MTRADLLRYLNGKQHRKLCHNTTVSLSDNNNDIIVRYYNTEILNYWQDNNGNEFVLLNSGGWYTTTTKFRINRLTGLGLYQKNFDWFVTNPTGEDLPFENNMILAI